MRSLKWLISLGFLLMGCMTSQERIQKFTYMKDSRTNLCFVAYCLGQEYGTMSNVPCTDEVEKAIRIDRETLTLR